MQIKVTHKPTGIPQAEVAVAYGTTELGAHQVTAFIRAVDSHGISMGVATLRMTPDEARDLAVRLFAEADKAPGPEADPSEEG